MRFTIKTKPGAKRDFVEKIDASHLTVSVRARAKDGEANEAVEKLLAEYFCVTKSCVQIVHGHSSRQKIVEIK